MDNLDRKLEQFYSENIELPEWYKYTIRNTLREENSKIYYKSKMTKSLVWAFSCLVLITTVVLATDNGISNRIKNYFKVNKGMDTAIDNGYIAETDMKYIDSNNTEVKVTNYLMDDFNLSFMLDVKFDEFINISDIDKIKFPDFLITDEEKRIIYCDNREIFDDYNEKNNLQYEFGKYNDNYINNGINIYIKEKDFEENSLRIVFNLYSNNYPKSKKLFFDFNTIQIFGENTSFIKGIWNLNIDIPEEFYNREGIVYRVKKCSDDRITVEKAVVYDTCMKLKFSMKLYNDLISKDEIIEKIDKQNSRLEEKLIMANSDGIITEEEKNDIKEAWDSIIVFSDSEKDDYVETENGIKYYPSKSSTDDHGYGNGTGTGIIEFHQTYSLTKYDDDIDSLKVHLKYYDDGEWEDIVIELEK